MPGSGSSSPEISATLITRDAERTLARTLRSLRWVDEIVVVDSGSTDGTRSIAQRHGARFMERDWPGYGVQKSRAVAEARHPWILSVDADEAVSGELRDSILEALSDPGEHAGFEMEIHTWFLGRWLRKRTWRKDWKLRLFHRERGGFTDARVHESVQVEGPVGRLRGPLLHDPWRNVEHRLHKDNRYTSLSTRRDFEGGRRSGALRPFFRALGWFFREYVLRQGFLDGRAGLVNAGLVATYAFHRGVKLWELGLEEAGTAIRPDDEGEPDIDSTST